MLLSLPLLALALLQAAPQPRAVETTPTEPRPVTAAPATPPTSAARPEERVICRSERVVGSNRMQRVCMTRAQRQAVHDQFREARERMDTNRPAEPNEAE